MYSPAESVTSARNMAKTVSRDRILCILCILRVTTCENAVISAARDIHRYTHSIIDAPKDLLAGAQRAW